MSDCTSGRFGENLTWTFEDGTVTVSGEGEMRDYYTYDPLPLGSCRKDIREIRIHSGVTGIGMLAFFGCIELTSVRIPDSVTRIGASAFSGCISLPSIHIPDSVTRIGRNAFAFCGGLTSVRIPKRVTKIEGNVFTCCPSLSSISVYDSVTDIYTGAFGSNSFMLTVRSAETDEIRYRLWVGSYAADHFDGAQWRALVADCKFEAFDAIFRKLAFPDKIRAAMTRLQYPVDLSEARKTAYLRYLSGNAQRAVMLFIDENNMDGILALAQLGVIKKSNINAMIDHAIDRDAVACTMYLLNYKNELMQKKEK